MHPSTIDELNQHLLLEMLDLFDSNQLQTIIDNWETTPFLLPTNYHNCLPLYSPRIKPKRVQETDPQPLKAFNKEIEVNKNPTAQPQLLALSLQIEPSPSENDSIISSKSSPAIIYMLPIIENKANENQVVSVNELKLSINDINENSVELKVPDDAVKAEIINMQMNVTPNDIPNEEDSPVLKPKVNIEKLTPSGVGINTEHLPTLQDNEGKNSPNQSLIEEGNMFGKAAQTSIPSLLPAIPTCTPIYKSIQFTRHSKCTMTSTNKVLHTNNVRTSKEMSEVLSYSLSVSEFSPQIKRPRRKSDHKISTRRKMSQGSASEAYGGITLNNYEQSNVIM
jgi:hypothetical protein